MSSQQFEHFQILQLDLGLTDVSDCDCSAIRYVCECVSRRAGFMASAGITALLKKMDYKDVVVAIDGSVFRFDSNNDDDSSIYANPSKLYTLSLGFF